MTKSSQLDKWETDEDWSNATLTMLAEAVKSMREITTRTIKISDRVYYMVRIGEYCPFDIRAAHDWCHSQFGPENDKTPPYTWFLDTNRGFVFDTDDKRVAFLLKWGDGGKKD